MEYGEADPQLSLGAAQKNTFLFFILITEFARTAPSPNKTILLHNALAMLRLLLFFLIARQPVHFNITPPTPRQRIILAEGYLVHASASASRPNHRKENTIR